MFECFLSLGEFVSPYNSRPTLTFERSAQMPDESVHDRTAGGRADVLMLLLRLPLLRTELFSQCIWKEMLTNKHDDYLKKKKNGFTDELMLRI